MPRLSVPAAVFACLLAAGCGNDRTKPADIFTPRAPSGSKEARFPAAGMTFRAPANWRLIPGQSPEVFALTSGVATVSGWAYRRREPLPKGGEQLRAARDRLVDEVKRRDRDFRFTRRRTLRVAGAPAIEVVGQQAINKRRLRTRSVHVFRGRVEYVIEALAPPKDFARVDSGVLAPLLESLRVTGRAT